MPDFIVTAFKKAIFIGIVLAVLAAPIFNGYSINSALTPIATVAQWYLSKSLYQVFPREALLIFWDYFLLMVTIMFIILIFTPWQRSPDEKK
jgi:hypothetical protein